MTSLVLPPSSDDSEDAKIRNSDGSFKKKPIWKISRLATYDSKRQIRTKAMPLVLVVPSLFLSPSPNPTAATSIEDTHTHAQSCTYPH